MLRFSSLLIVLGLTASTASADVMDISASTADPGSVSMIDRPGAFAALRPDVHQLWLESGIRESSTYALDGERAVRHAFVAPARVAGDGSAAEVRTFTMGQLGWHAGDPLVQSCVVAFGLAAAVLSLRRFRAARART